MCLASHCDIMGSWNMNVRQCNTLCEKKIKLFQISECYNSCRNVKYIRSVHFPRSLLLTCSLETTTLCLNTRLHVNKYFEILIIFIEINVNDWHLCAHPVMTSIILHSLRSNCQHIVCYALASYVSADCFFAFWGAEKHVIHIAPYRPTRYVQKIFWWL